VRANVRTIKNLGPFLLILATMAAPGRDNPAVGGADDPEAVVGANNQFTVDLYKRLSARSGNLFLSPYSISTALAMTYGGAEGKTAEEMASVLRFPFGRERLHPAFAAVIKEVKGARSQDCQLNVANGLWAQRDYRFREKFKRIVKADYDAESRELDFTKASEEARQLINDWVKKQTEGKIEDLIAPGGITAQTRLVLANAIYFRGRWADAFEKQATKDTRFWVTPKQAIDVPMMFQEGEFQYLETATFQALCLNYGRSDLSMVVFLPRKVDGLLEFEKSLTLERLGDWLTRLQGGQQAKVFLPRFRVTATFTLNQVLSAMGMRQAFDPVAADFSGMTGGKGLFISLIVHKAFVDVDEKGTEAAAATAVVGPLAAAPSRPRRPVVFRADHPFLFLIHDWHSGSFLFIGRVTNPKA
jgi:serpin B